MKDTNKLNLRLGYVLVLVMLAGLVLAACGGGGEATEPSGGTSTEAPEGGVSPVATEDDGGAAVGETATAPAGETAGATVGATAGATVGATAGATEGATVGATAGATATGEAPTGNTGEGGDCGLGADLPAIQIPEDADPNGAMTYNMEIDVDSADPQQASFAYEINVMSQVYTSLLTLNPELEPVPAGAESCTVSADGKTFTLKIREHNYSDGQPVTAQNYAYAIKRNCDPKVNGEYSAIMFDIVGCQESREAFGDDPEKPKQVPDAQLKQLLDAVQVRAVDDRTLEITTVKANGYFPFILTLWTTNPVRQDLVEKGGARWWAKPENYIGNGPFKVDTYTPKRQWVFSRNDGYFRGEAGLARMTFAQNNEPNNFIPAYQRGQYDMVEPPSTQLPRLNANAELKAQLARQPSPLSLWFDMNLARPPFDKVQVRQALAYAFDRQLFIRQIRNGSGVPSTQLQPSSAVPAGRIPDEQGQKLDLARAKELLSEAGYPNGQGFPSVPFEYGSDDADGKRAAEWISQHMKQQLNITLQPVAVDPVELVNRRKSNDPRKQPAFNGGGWYQDYPHPQNWGSVLFGPGSGFAPAGWNQETAGEYYELIRKADAEPDLEKAGPLYADANVKLIELAPVIFTVYGEDFRLSKPYIKGIVPLPGDIIGLQRQSFNIYRTR